MIQFRFSVNHIRLGFLPLQDSQLHSKKQEGTGGIFSLVTLKMKTYSNSKLKILRASIKIQSSIPGPTSFWISSDKEKDFFNNLRVTPFPLEERLNSKASNGTILGLSYLNKSRIADS
jgi:hypothetical protein